MMLLIKHSHLPQSKSKSKSKRDKNEEAGSKIQLDLSRFRASFYIWLVDLDQRKRTCRTSCQHHDYAYMTKHKT